MLAARDNGVDREKSVVESPHAPAVAPLTTDANWVPGTPPESDQMLAVYVLPTANPFDSLALRHLIDTAVSTDAVDPEPND